MAKAVPAKRPRRAAAPASDPPAAAAGPTPAPLVALAAQIDATARDVIARREAVDAARAALEHASRDYSDGVARLNALHAEYETLIEHVLTVGGTVHVAKP